MNKVDKTTIKYFTEEMIRLGFTIEDVLFYGNRERWQKFRELFEWVDYDNILRHLQSQLPLKKESEAINEKNKLLTALRSSECRDFCNQMINEYGVWNHLDLADWLENQ